MEIGLIVFFAEAHFANNLSEMILFINHFYSLGKFLAHEKIRWFFLAVTLKLGAIGLRWKT